MKRNLVAVYLVLLHGLLALVLWKSDFLTRLRQKVGGETADPTRTAHYSNMRTYQMRMDGSVPDGSVVFVGDSLVQSLCTDAVISPSVNFGIGGDTTAGVLGRISGYQSLRKARAVVLAVGFNDLKSRTDRELIANYREILRKLPPGLPVVVSAILPVHEELYRKHASVTNGRIRAINEELAKLCAERPERVFVDTGKLLAGPDGNLSTAMQVGDGVHLNSDGYRIWIEALKTGIASGRSGR